MKGINARILFSYFAGILVYWFNIFHSLCHKGITGVLWWYVKDQFQLKNLKTM